MAFLFGQDGAGYTTAGDLIAGPAAGALISSYESYTAASSGTAITAYLNVSAWNTSSDALFRVYRASDGALMGTATFTSGQGTGVITAAFASSFAVSSGQSYFCTVAPNQRFTLVQDTSTGTFSIEYVTGGYASPPNPFVSGAYNNDAPRDFYAWVDGTIGGGGGDGATLAWTRA